jgi:hypothetical protein
MRYPWITLHLLCCCFVSGCSQDNSATDTGQLADNTASTESATPTADAAKAHVQGYVDRLLGGDQSVKDALLGTDGVDFKTIDSIQISTVVQEYSKDGKKLEGWFRVVLLVSGVDGLNGRAVTKNITRTASYSNGEWSLMFSK